MAGKIVDLIFIYQFLKRLTTPFEKTEAFKLGIIDKNGKKIKDPQGNEEEDAYGYFDRLVFNIKKLIERVPGGKSQLASYAAALYLIREHANPKEEYTEEELIEGWMKAMDDLDLEDVTGKTFKQLQEEAPANATGSGVVGTGDDVANWKKVDARKKEVKEFLRRYLESKGKRDKLREVKKRKEILARFGLDK
jgi:hypothetical protein